MNHSPSLLPRKALLAIAAVIDVALHARPTPVAAKALAERHHLPPRHLETLLQDLVRAHILKGVRGPKGGYELARERRRISFADIVRAAMDGPNAEHEVESNRSVLETAIQPYILQASGDFLSALDQISVEQVCQSLDRSIEKDNSLPDFTI
jgi:Rrf2 family protein